MYTYIIYWTAGSSSILVFIAPLLSAYFRLDLLLTWLNEKILTCSNIALDIFSIIISRFIPCSIIVRMGSCSKKFKCYSIMKWCLAFGYCPLHGLWSWEGRHVKPWCKLQVTLVAQRIPTELIWKLFQGEIFPWREGLLSTSSSATEWICDSKQVFVFFFPTTMTTILIGP